MSIPNTHIYAHTHTSCEQLCVTVRLFFQPSSTPDQVFERAGGSHSCASYCCNINTHTPPSVSFSAFLTPAIHLIPASNPTPTRIPAPPPPSPSDPPVPGPARPVPPPKNAGAASRTHQTDANAALGSARKKKRGERKSGGGGEGGEGGRTQGRPQSVCDISWVHK